MSLNEGRKQKLRIHYTYLYVPTNTFIYLYIPVYTSKWGGANLWLIYGLSMDYLGIRRYSLPWRRCRPYWFQ